MGDQIGRRRFLATATGAAVAVGPGLALPASAAQAADSAPTAGDAGWAGWFARPGAAVRPKVRWWWPDGLVDPVQIRRDSEEMAGLQGFTKQPTREAAQPDASG